jgi:hypothetical protein
MGMRLVVDVGVVGLIPHPSLNGCGFTTVYSIGFQRVYRFASLCSFVCGAARTAKGIGGVKTESPCVY